ncbi:hypothetical protein BIV57_13640 [Mangrovactinospora gilvigrisea]|uniref:Peptidase n=2 Tax=Mangrovactinospora gilvigrisea TaxID=1428644 RepID=A0A1J7BE36_9ACTN|nr:hypothetical protein BIV57_13640 [Mangrovactinospora gilvigrisea]
MRGPLAPPQVPIALTRSELFDDLVRDSVERLQGRWGKELDGVEFEIQEVPAEDDLEGGDGGDGDDAVPLARLVVDEGGASGRGRIVVFRRPIELRATGRTDRAALVHDLIVEQVADLLGLEPDAVDPRYGEE